MMYEDSQDEKTYTDPSPWLETSLIHFTSKQGQRTVGFAGTPTHHLVIDFTAW